MPTEKTSTFATRLKERLELELPGPALQARMAPSHRESIDPEIARLGHHREGSVLVLLDGIGSELSTILTVRRSDLRDHGGQISFPGGRREAGESLEDTALREAAEEVGLDRSRVTVVGQLTQLFIPPSRFVVQPFVAVADHTPQLEADEREVAEILDVRLSELRDPANRRSETWTIGGEQSLVPYYQIGEHRVWGATAMIVTELIAVIDSLTNM